MTRENTIYVNGFVQALLNSLHIPGAQSSVWCEVEKHEARMHHRHGLSFNQRTFEHYI